MKDGRRNPFVGRDSLFVPCDVTQKDQVQAMVQRMADQFGRLDIAVNNAGIGILGGRRGDRPGGLGPGD